MNFHVQIDEKIKILGDNFTLFFCFQLLTNVWIFHSMKPKPLFPCRIKRSRGNFLLCQIPPFLHLRQGQGGKGGGGKV